METPRLLNAPKKMVRDAARAAKRVTGFVMQRITAGTLNELLGLPGLVVNEYGLEKQGGIEILHLFCQHRAAVAVCPRCHELSTAVHDSEERSVRHLDIWGKATFIHFPSRRFDCSHCRKPFTEELAWLESNRRESQAFEMHIYAECLHTDQSAVAEGEHLHPETVKGIFQRWARRAEKQRQAWRVRCLGVDEISLRKGHQQFALVLSDLERHCVLAVLPERSQTALENWLETLSPTERRAIRVVAMDMWGPYRGVIKSKLAHAQIVADRFHVTRQLNDAIAKIRRSLQANTEKAAYEILKGTRWILVRNRAELKPAEDAKLQAALDAFPELRKAYLLKEQFRLIADKIRDRRRAERFLRAWIWEAQASGIPQLVKFAKTLRHWWEEFLNYFDEGITSGTVEGLNNAIRAIIRRAFGYPIFENFRLQVLAEQGELCITPPLI